MKVVFTEKAREEFTYWSEVNPKNRDRILELLKNMVETPFAGIGKPEKLLYDKPHWSRRITKEHRLVYRVDDNTITVISCRYHYTK